MKLSTLISRAQLTFEKYGDLDCCIDNDADEDFVLELEEIVVEFLENGNKHLLLTGYEIVGNIPTLTLVK